MSDVEHQSYFARQMAEAKASARSSTAPAAVISVPRVMLAGIAADSGTTAVHLAVLAAMKRSGISVQPFHAAGAEQEAVLQAYVSGRLPHMLDSWLLDKETLQFLIGKQSGDCELATMEASGGFFDGLYEGEAARLQTPATLLPGGSAAELAMMLSFPVILILRPRGSRQSILAELRGFLRCFDEAVAASKKSQQTLAGAPGSLRGGIKGVILNELSAEMYPELKSYIERHTKLSVLGYMPPLPAFSLKLSTKALGDSDAAAWQRLPKAIRILADEGTRYLDMDGILKLAQSAPAWKAVTPPGLLRLQKQTQALGRPRIGIAVDKSFFSYNQDNLELLAESGAKLVPFSPTQDEALPESLDALYLGGVFCPERIPLMSQKKGLAASIRQQARQGMPVWAEGQGAVYLSAGYLVGHTEKWPLAALLPFTVSAPRRPGRTNRAAEDALQLGAEMQNWEENYWEELEDSDNPRGISTWNAAYCILEGKEDGLLLAAGQKVKALGQATLLQNQDAKGLKARTREQGFFLTGVNLPRIYASDARVILYSEPEILLRFMQAATAYRRSKDHDSANK